VISPKGVLSLGLISFFFAVPIGIYFIFERGMSLVPLFIIGAFFVLGYTPFLSKMGRGVGEFSAGLGLGSMPLIGIYYILTGHLTGAAIYASIPSGFLVMNLLLLNEFPDVEADKLGMRKTLPMVIGKTEAAVVYSMLTLGTYLWIALGVITKLMPTWTLLGCLALPLGLKAITGSFSHDNMEKLKSALGANVMAVLLTQVLMGIGFILSRLELSGTIP
jgi:1,4-dihydroxy-2-naphthoate octaprenyltransferase